MFDDAVSQTTIGPRAVTIADVSSCEGPQNSSCAEASSERRGLASCRTHCGAQPLTACRRLLMGTISLEAAEAASVAAAEAAMTRLATSASLRHSGGAGARGRPLRNHIQAACNSQPRVGLQVFPLLPFSCISKGYCMQQDSCEDATSISSRMLRRIRIHQAAILAQSILSSVQPLSISVDNSNRLQEACTCYRLNHSPLVHSDAL